jgi:hypothetical protein
MAQSGIAALVAALLEDPEVRQHVQQDPELREMWSDAAVRGPVENAPGMMAAMQRLMELTRGLVSDPAVQARIEADPELRALWADPGTRRRVLGTPPLDR